jgi:hypothetical protein
LVGGITNVTDNEPQWDPLFKYLGKSIQSQRSRAGRMQLFGNTFVSVGFVLSSSVGFRSVVPVGSLTGLLEDGWRILRRKQEN